MSKLKRASSLLVVFVCTAAVGFGQEKQPPKEKKEPEVVASIVKQPAEYDAAAWKKFESARGGFSILFPGTPEEETKKHKRGEHKVGVYTLKLHSLAAYTVAYFDNAAEQNPDKEATRKLLDAAARQATQMFQATMLEQKEITLDGHAGMSHVMRLPEGLILRLRVYAVRGQLYQLSILTPSEQGATEDQRRFYEATASKFLDSFTLAPDAPARDSVGVLGPSGPIATGSVRAEAVSAPKNLPRAPISAGVLNGKAVSKPNPAYPAAALKERVEGVVTVAVVVDEEGRVMAAEAVGGHELLREAAVAAARKARFSITRLAGQPVKVSGRLVYNFVLR